MIQSHEATVRRLLCTGYLLIRHGVELHADTEKRSVESIESGVSIMNDVKARIGRQGIRADFSECEWALLAKPVGAWTYRERTDTGWYYEHLGVLLAVLHLSPGLSPYDTQFHVPFEEFGWIPHHSVSEVVDKTKMRPEAEIQQARDMAELWLWRARTEIHRQHQPVPQTPGWTYPQIIKLAAEQAVENGWIKETAKDDFPAYGKAYSDLDEKERRLCHSIALERLRIFNWLCGRGTDIDDVEVDT